MNHRKETRKVINLLIFVKYLFYIFGNMAMIKVFISAAVLAEFIHIKKRQVLSLQSSVCLCFMFVTQSETA